MLDGTERPGRYNRAGERTLYLSGSPAGVAAAMIRYGDADRTIVRVNVAAEQLVDLRDRAAEVGPKEEENWLALMNAGGEPRSWRVADDIRIGGANGLVERSRHAPMEWHLVLFRWNVPGGASVTTIA